MHQQEDSQRRELHSLNSSGADWRFCLAEVLRDRLGYESCQGDYDVWFRSAQRPNSGKYYKYVIAYTDNILCLSCIPTATFSHLDCLLTPDSMGPLRMYLGAAIGKCKFGVDDVGTWDQSNMLQKL
jgi:hypothetical protein